VVGAYVARPVYVEDQLKPRVGPAAR
jgi:hypothetical protein